MKDLLLTSKMLVELADVVQSFMEEGYSFSYYDIFCEARQKHNWDFRYVDVRDEIRDAIKAAVGQGGGYKASYYHDKDNDCIYLLFSPESNEEAEEDSELEGYDEAKALIEYLKVDDKNRIYIPKRFVEFSGMSKRDYVAVNYFKDANTMTITEVKDYSADKSSLIKFNPSGFHVSVGKMVQDFIKPIEVKITVVDNFHNFELTM